MSDEQENQQPTEDELEAALDSIFGESGEFEDPGPEGYDPAQGALVRELMTRVAAYAESGPTFDPKGKYLCEDCQMRILPDLCSHVSGEISMLDGSCKKWIIGPQSWPIQIMQWSQEEAGYGRRPEAKGFGCSRCEYGAEAKQADEAGRSIWCKRFGARVMPLACCEEEDGKDFEQGQG